MELSPRTATTSNTPTATNPPCQQCTTNTVGCESHAILDCPYSKHMALPIIRKIHTLIYIAWQASWDSLLISQQISLILGNPPELLLKKLHQTWTEATLKEILPYISSLKTLLYTSNTTTVLSPPQLTKHQPLPHHTHQ